MKHRLLLITTVLLGLSLGLTAAEAPTDAAARVDGLEHQLIAPCCWSEPIAYHRSQIALDICDRASH